MMSKELETKITNVEKRWIDEVNSRENSGRTLTRFHASWGPKVVDMTEDEMLGYLREVENSPKQRVRFEGNTAVPIDENGNDVYPDFPINRKSIDVREWVASLDNPPASGIEKNEI